MALIGRKFLSPRNYWLSLLLPPIISLPQRQKQILDVNQPDKFELFNRFLPSKLEEIHPSVRRGEYKESVSVFDL